MIPASTPTENRSSMNPIAAQWPIPGIANVRENRSPYDSMIVSSSTMKPQNVAACAAPGTDHFSSFRCPTTSVSWVSTSLPGCLRTARHALRRGLPGKCQSPQPPHPPPGDRERRRGQHQANDYPQVHA